MPNLDASTPNSGLNDAEYLNKLADLKAASDAKIASLMAMKSYVPQPTVLDSVGSTAKDIGIKLAQGAVDLGQSVVGLGSLATGGLIGQGMHAIGYDPEATNQFLGQYLSPEQQASDQKVQQAQGFKDTLMAALQNPRAIAGSVAESLPGMLGGMAATEVVASRIAMKAALETAEGQAALRIGKTPGEAAAAAMTTPEGQKAVQGAIDASEGKLLLTGAVGEGAQTTGQIADQAQGQGRDYSDYALPAIAAGVGTGGLNLLAGKLMGSAATDMAAGTHTLKGNLITKLGKEAFSEGVLEELPQSAQEQVWTNIATGKEWDDGVGNAAASGLVAGAAMGAGFGALHGSHASDGTKLTPRQSVEKAVAFKEAVQKNDPSVFLDENGKNYDPVAAIGALAQHNLGPDTDFNTKVDNYDRATQIMDKVSQKQEELNKLLKTGSNDEKKAAKQSLKQLESVNSQGQAIWNRMLDELQNSMSDLNVDQHVEQANTPVNEGEAPTPEVQSSIDHVINLSMASPRALSAEQAANLAENTDNGLNQEQRDYLRSFSTARQDFNAAQDVGSVQRQVLYGEKNQAGIEQHRQRIGAAIQTGNQDMAQRSLDALIRFASDHIEKAAVAEVAAKSGGQVYRTENGWGVAKAGTYDSSKLREGGGLPIVKPRLLQALQAEAKALAATRDEMTQAVKLKFAGQDQGVPVQSGLPTAAPTTSVAPTVSPASLFREMREREGRVEDGEPSSPQTSVSAPVLTEGEQVTPMAAAPQINTAAPSTGSQASGPVAADAAPATPASPVSVTAQNTQQAATEQPASASEASSAPAAEVAPAAEAQSVPVQAILEKGETVEGDSKASYLKKRLGDFFRQIGQGTNPLASVRDYISSIQTVQDFAAFLNGDLAGREQALDGFLRVARAWAPRVSQNLDLTQNADYAFNDAMRYFIKDGDIEENVKTAVIYAAYSYAAENFGKEGANSQSDINRLLGRQKEVGITPDEHAQLHDVLASLPAVAEALGQRVVKALGFEALKNTPASELKRLQSGLGAHALRLLTDSTRLPDTKHADGTITKGKLVPAMIQVRELDKKTVEGWRKRDQQMVDTSGTEDARASNFKENKERFIIINRPKGKLNPVADFIVKANRDSRSAVNELFSVETAAKPPTLAPVKSSKPKAKRTDQQVPSFLMRILNKLNGQKNFIRQDKMEILSRLGDERFLSMMGVQPVTPAISAGNRDALDASNNGLKRELDGIKEFFNSYLKGDASTPFYFEHYAMSQQRVGIANNLVNPQLSKIHRFMVYRNSWVSQVDMTDASQLQNFWLRVGEGMGVSTDKASRIDALDKITEMLFDPKVQAGVAALRKINTGEHLSEAEQDAIVDAVAVGGENAHSLDALVAMAQYYDANDNKQTKFTVNMLAEVDGVTNGPMLSHLLMGAANSSDQLLDMLKRGGFFTTEGQQFNDWRSSAGAMDLYETTSSNVLDTLATMQRNKFNRNELAVLGHVMSFMGKLKDPVTGKIEKAGRSMIKTPLTALVYGSGMKAAINGMAHDFIANIYKSIEKSSAMMGTAKEAEGIALHQKNVVALRGLGLDIAKNISVEELMEKKFSKQEANNLIAAFTETLGQAVKATIKSNFKQLLDNRKDFNSTASLAFSLYDAAYESTRQQLVDELTAKGELPVVRGEAVTDLNPQQEAELDRRMALITPTLQTAMSNLSGPASAQTGMLMAKSTLQPATTMAYKNQVQFGTPFMDAKSLIVYARKIKNSNPGVALGATSTHSFDSAVSHSAIRGREILNLHDAHGTAITDLASAGQRLNQAVWDRAMEYSPAQEAYNSLLRTIRGIDALLNDKNIPAGTVEALARNIVAEAIKGEKYDQYSDPLTYLKDRAIAAKVLAFRTDSIKYAAMARMQSIAQYAVEGGNFEVTEDHRRAAQAKLDALTAAMSEADTQLVESVQTRLSDTIGKAELDYRDQQAGRTAAESSKIGALGTPAVQSDLKLTNYLRQQPVQSASQLINFLKTQNLTPFQKTLLGTLNKALGARGNNVSVQYVQSTTPVQAVLALPEQPSHAWFVSKEGKSQINILSAEFKDSGLTLETLLHELTHAAIAHAIAAPDEHTRPLVEELENLRQIAQQLIYENKMPELLPAVASVQELVAWGMTNPALQQLLDSHLMQSKNGENKWVSGFKQFIDTLVNLVFGRENPHLSTGLSVLVTNVTGLLAKSAQGSDFKGYINQSMATPLASLNGEDMYDALGQIGHSNVSPAFDAKLREMIRSLDDSVHSPLAAMKQIAQQNAVQTPYAMWVLAKRKGQAPFARNALASGFRFSEQEAFALEQVEATVRTALDTRDGSTTALYRELVKLYNEARDTLKTRIGDFHPDPVQAKALYDFIFTMKPGMGDRSDYLSRFASLGMANEQFSKLLDFNTAVSQKPLGSMSFADRLHALFERFLGWINARATATYEGQKADDKLHALVNQLVDVEQRKRMKLSQTAAVLTDTFEQMFGAAVTAGKQTITKLANAPLFKSSSNGILRLTGSLTSVVASNRLNDYMDAMQTYRDKFIGERNGTLMGILNEVRGAHDGNVQMHALLRVSKRIEAVRKELITNTASFVRDSFKDKGKYLTEAMHDAISAVLLRGDVQSLLTYFDMTGLHQIITDKTARDTAIGRFEQQLIQFGSLATPYRNGAEMLGYFMATGRAGGANLLLNPENIANRLGTQFANKVDAATVAKAVPVIDALTSLYALKHLAESSGSKIHIGQLDQVFKQEMGRTDKGNGLEFTLKMHQQLQNESKERLFDGKGALRMKGYTPEIYNPYIRLQVADYLSPDRDGKTPGEKLTEIGYAPGAEVRTDDADPDRNEKRLYSLRDGGLIQHSTGVFSYTGQRRRGSAVHDGNLNMQDSQGQMNIGKMKVISAGQAKSIADQQTRRIDPKQGALKNSYLVPVFNADGQRVNYRYMMAVETKDNLLERDNRFDNMLGVMAGNIFDKEKTAEQNRTAVQALYDQYKADYNKNPASYMEVGPNSLDDEARQTWNLLPEVTKQAVKDIWGTDSMKVRIDQMDINFGYRKLSLSTPFGIPEAARNDFEDAYVRLLEAVLGKKAGLYVRRGEDIWQTLVREAKDTMVVKSGTTLLGNFTSNVSELIWFGVPLSAIWQHHRTALKGVTAYRNDSRELASLETSLKLGQLNGRSKEEMERRMVQLKDALARNPVRELVEAGLMPTIVEDIAEDEDRYSYKSMITNKVDNFVGNLNPVLLKAGKYAVMAHDTPVYKALSYATQVSDFLARYTLYQHVLHQAKNPMNAQQAIQLVNDAFVNYDVPSHRNMQYANDMGLLYFSKYYLRIQKVIGLLYRQNPGRAMMLLTAGHFLDFIPMLQHSAFIHRIGNPFSTGAFEAVSSLTDMLSVKTLMTPFK